MMYGETDRSIPTSSLSPLPISILKQNSGNDVLSSPIQGIRNVSIDNPLFDRHLLGCRSISDAPQLNQSMSSQPLSILKSARERLVTANKDNEMGILRRKCCSLGGTVAHSPEGPPCFATLTPILKKSSCSSGCLEDFLKQNSKLADDEIFVAKKSILKNKLSHNNYEQFEDGRSGNEEHGIFIEQPPRPRSILKSRKSEDDNSLSASSDSNAADLPPCRFDETSVVFAMKPILKQHKENETFSNGRILHSPCRSLSIDCPESHLRHNNGRKLIFEDLNDRRYGSRSPSRQGRLMAAARARSMEDTRPHSILRSSQSEEVVASLMSILKPSRPPPSSPPPSLLSASDLGYERLSRRQKSILKPDSSLSCESVNVDNTSSDVSPSSERLKGNQLKGVLKKDSSYEEMLKPILKNMSSSSSSYRCVDDYCCSSSSTSSVEDIIRTFSNVIIDPVRRRNSASHIDSHINSDVGSDAVRRRSTHEQRSSMIPPSSVNICVDENLGHQLERLSGKAAAIRRLKLSAPASVGHLPSSELIP